MGMKPMKLKLTKYWEKRKERKETKNRYVELIEVDEQDLHTLKLNCNGTRTVERQTVE